MRMDVMRDVVGVYWCGSAVAVGQRQEGRHGGKRRGEVRRSINQIHSLAADQPDTPQPGCYTQNMYSRVMPARALAGVGPADVASYAAAACRCALVGPRGPGCSPSDKEPPTDDEDDDEAVRGRGGGPGCRGITSDLPLPPGGSVAPWR